MTAETTLIERRYHQTDRSFYSCSATTRDAFETKHVDAVTKRFNETTTRDDFGIKSFDAGAKRFDETTTRDAFGTKSFNAGTKRFNEMTTRDAFETERFDAGAKRVDGMTEHDAFGIKPFAAMKFSGGIAAVRSEIGHGHGFFDTNRTDSTGIRRRRRKESLTENLKPGIWNESRHLDSYDFVHGSGRESAHSDSGGENIRADSRRAATDFRDFHRWNPNPC